MHSPAWPRCSRAQILAAVAGFDAYGSPPTASEFRIGATSIPRFEGVFFDPRQRAADPLHEISYRACYKPELPRFFILQLTHPGDVVLDPFLGRGTTAVEASLLDRIPWGSDLNPLSPMLCRPRLHPPTLPEIARRLATIDLTWSGAIDAQLRVFFHLRTLREILALRQYLLRRESSGELDVIDEWIRMVAANRLTGHSPGFFSRFSLPPNQAASVAAQRRINARYGSPSTYRPIVPRILRKCAALLSAQPRAAKTSSIHISSADDLHWAPAESVSLVVTSPPFLDVVDYSGDNWMRAWFCGISPVAMERRWEMSDPAAWAEAMRRFLVAASRPVKRGGWIAVEVGGVRNGEVQLDALLAEAGRSAGLDIVLAMVNSVQFTRTSHLWRVENGAQGTNTNRVILMRKP